MHRRKRRQLDIQAVQIFQTIERNNEKSFAQNLLVSKTGFLHELENMIPHYKVRDLILIILILITKQLRQILQSLLGRAKDSMDLHDILAILVVAHTYCK